MSRMFVLGLVLFAVGGIAIGLIHRSSSSSKPSVHMESDSSQQPPVSQTQQPPRDIFELERARNAPLPGLEARLGTDDGFVAAIFYGGDTLGSLEVCG
ncbi:MAG TPA: hypothetical protein VNM72_11640 [Blastocatellia bacterium]|nr:hypothetical protein [Blastocatellia bacterium]